jgi:hypothetical protein
MALIDLAEGARRCLPTARLSEVGARRALQGKTLSSEHFMSAPEQSADVTAWLAADGSLVALGRWEAPHGFRVVRGFQASRRLSEP